MDIETNPQTIELKIKSKTDEAMRYTIINELALLGISECPSKTIDHSIVLEDNSDFNWDSRMIREGVDNVITVLEKNKIFIFTEEQKKEMSLAALWHDIGKSSSSEDLDCQLAVVRLFSARNIKKEYPGSKVSVAVEINFPNEADTIMYNLSKVQVTPDMKIRAFWDMHAFWTKEILDESSVFSERTKQIAASHHLNRGINPYGIVENKISDELKYGIYILMVIDKYQARIIRGGAIHKEAMEYLRDDLKKYNDDSVMASVIKTIDELGKVGIDNIFPLSEIEKLNTKERKGL